MLSDDDVLYEFLGVHGDLPAVPTEPLPAHRLFDARHHVFDGRYAILKFQPRFPEYFSSVADRLKSIRGGDAPVSSGLLARALYMISDPDQRRRNTEILQANFEFPNMNWVLSSYGISTESQLRKFAAKLNIRLPSARDALDMACFLRIWQVEYAPLRTRLSVPIVKKGRKTLVQDLARSSSRVLREGALHFYLGRKLDQNRFETFATRVIPCANIILFDRLECAVLVLSTEPIDTDIWEQCLRLIRPQIKTPGSWRIQTWTVREGMQGVYTRDAFAEAFLYWFVEVRALTHHQKLESVQRGVEQMFVYDRDTSERLLRNYSVFLSAVAASAKKDIARDLLDSTAPLAVDETFAVMRPDPDPRDLGIMFPLTKGDLAPVVDVAAEAPQTVNRDKAILLYLFARHGSVCLNTDVENINFDVGDDAIVETNIDVVVRAVRDCLRDTRRRFIAMGMSVFKIGDQVGHHNSLIFDAKSGTLEWFEPNGVNVVSSWRLVAESLETTFQSNINGFGGLLLPIQTLNGGLQNQQCLLATGCATGTCVAWSVLYQDLRLMYPDVRRDRLLLRMNQTLLLDPTLFGRIASPFQRFLSILDTGIANKSPAEALAEVRILINAHIKQDYAWRAPVFGDASQG